MTIQQFGIASFCFIVLFLLSCILEWKKISRDMTEIEKNIVIEKWSEAYPHRNTFRTIWNTIMLIFAILTLFYISFFFK